MLTQPGTYSVTCTDALLREVIPQFRIEKPLTCEFWCQGLNDSYKITTANNMYLLRIYRCQWQSLAEIRFELDGLLHLQANGVHVAYPIITNNDDYIVSLTTPEGPRHIILTTYISGSEVEFSCPESAPLYAQHMAQIHLYSEQFKTANKLDVKHLLNEPKQRIKPFLTDRQSDWLFIKNSAKKLAICLQEALDKSPDIGFCHGDMHGGNAHYNGIQLGSFDVDCCAIGLRVYDLAIFKWSLKHDKKEDSIWQLFLHHYQQHRPLDNNDLQLIDTLVCIRHIWLIGLHIDIAVAKGWLNDHYFDQKIAFLHEQEILTNT